ncbi:copper resistance system multicopper oxidase [Guyparkeria hydrothermalis]|uniref:copper resistance system multicopper oxidase n=1 Tax=Guyparkeria hydrothermalis TaxID=923 RepID=UPI0020204D38|nr:copper resistance system multicopper oxidase [Guyparkeria hydrothermalis]MCL7744385.1 copper resistance system multicopper oxidase [Guyparkeria hydrothermalis]
MDQYETLTGKGHSRRRFLRNVTSMSVLAALYGYGGIRPALGWPQAGNHEAERVEDGDTDIFNLVIDRTPMKIDGKPANPVTVNGTVPGPAIRMREGRNVRIRIQNKLDEWTSIHWHGILLPFQMDGVPGVTFKGIPPKDTFEYYYPLKQAGTYWYHSHSGLQEQLGHYGPLIVEPAQPEPYEYDRDYVVMLSDWTFEDPHDVFRNLKVAEGYYNYQKRTVQTLLEDIEKKGWAQTMRERAMWGEMGMSSRDILDVTGSTYTYLMNGRAPRDNWTGLFKPGEKIRLRFINGSAMTFFDVRIPGLKMTVVQADGQDVEPVPVDEFRIGVAETYDVIVEPEDEQAYTIFAEVMDRSGFAAGTLATEVGMQAEIPAPRPMPERGMAAMGMDMGDMDMAGMDMKNDMDMKGGMDMGGDMKAKGDDMAGMSSHSGKQPASKPSSGGSMDIKGGHDMAMADGADASAWPLAGRTIEHGPDKHGPGAAMVAMNPRNRMSDPGVGLENTPEHRVLVYDDLRAHAPWPDQREPEREVELHLTGNMERYMWSFDGQKFSEVDGPIQFHYGERLRLILVNDTMMEHPIHLHGMWMELENRHGEYRPRKHTLSLKPGEMVSARITADAKGHWAFHCHLLYHMKAGMFRVVSVA